MWKNDIVHKEFEKCAKEHINSDDIRYRVYRRGLEYPVFAEELKSIILPVYQSAQNCGFGEVEVLKREILEELDTEITIGELVETIE